MLLKFYVKNQTLIYKGNETIASGSKNYLYAEFRFTKEWAEMSKTAVFVSADGERRYHMLLDDGRCAVPADMIAEGGFYVSVFGGDRITSTQVYIDVAQSGVEPGLTPPEPTDDLYAQIMNKIDEVSNELETMEFEIAENSVTEEMLRDSSVTESKIGAEAVTESKIKTEAVTEKKIGVGAVTEEKISTGAVTKNKISTGAVTEEKIAEKAIKPSHLADETLELFHNHSNKAVLDNITGADITEMRRIASEEIDIEERAESISHFSVEGISHWHRFPYELNETFEIYNDYDDELTSVYYNDTVSWMFSEVVAPGESYLVRITKMPVSTVDVSENGIVEVIRSTNVTDTRVIEAMYDAINEVYVQLADAANELAELI